MPGTAHGVGSLLGAFIGGALVPWAPSEAITSGLGVILIVSAIRIFGSHTSHSRRAWPAACHSWLTRLPLLGQGECNRLVGSCDLRSPGHR